MKAEVTEYHGHLRPGDFRIAIVSARFNSFITESLLDGAVSTLLNLGIPREYIEVYHVPGSFEIPVTIKKILEQKKELDGVIALGAVIRGDTAHFDFVAGEAAKGIGNLALQYGKPVMFGIITTDTVEQAMNRAGIKLGNKGSEAALGLFELLQMYRTAGLS